MSVYTLASRISSVEYNVDKLEKSRLNKRCLCRNYCYSWTCVPKRRSVVW